MPLMKGLSSPTELAALVSASLNTDASGNLVLDPARCRLNGSCATARDYFKGICAAHPDAKLSSITDLPRYLRSLVPQPAPSGEWYMSRLLVKGMSHHYDAVGWHRRFFKGETVWDDPNTGEHILAGDCGNVVGARYWPQECVTARFVVRPGDEVRDVILTPNYLPASCWRVCDGKDCHAPPSPCDQCNWASPEGVVPRNYKPRYSGVYVAHSAVQTFRFPREVKKRYLAFCVVRKGRGEADAWIVPPEAWGRKSHLHIPYAYSGHTHPVWPVWGYSSIDHRWIARQREKNRPRQ